MALLTNKTNISINRSTKDLLRKNEAYPGEEFERIILRWAKKIKAKGA